MSTITTHEIVILGANFAGINLTHCLLRQAIPTLNKLDPSENYHITLVSPNTHFYFKIAGPRALISPTSIPADKIFKSIPKAVAQYTGRCSFVQGKAVGLEPENRIVKIEQHGSDSKSLRYNSLFLCTGTTSASPLWTLHDGHEMTQKALKDMNSCLPEAKTVLIAGGGPVGFETAGEISYAFPSIKITLVAGRDVLHKLKPATIAKAKSFLSNANVEVLTNTHVNSSSAEGSATKVELSDGSSRTIDVYIDASGAKKINSDFLPKSWLDQSGRVVMLDNYFRVKGDGQADVSNIYAIGDVVAGSANTAMELDAMIPTAVSSFVVDMASNLGQETGRSNGLLDWIPGFGSRTVSQKEFKPVKETILVPFGPNCGVGQAFGWQMPSFMVKKGKSEKFLVELVEPAITGSKYGKA